MKTKMLLLVSLFFILLSCNRNKETVKESEELCMTIHPRSASVEKMISQIVYYGDTNAYLSLFFYYEDEYHVDECLFCSLIMANKYDYTPAYYDIFCILTMPPGKYIYFREFIPKGFSSKYCFDSLDDRTKQMALSYFREAVYKGYYYASEELLNKYDKGKYLPIEELYSDKKLMDKARQNCDAAKNN
jgi:hypothetical protein